MMRLRKGFDSIAPYYDLLARIIFGKAIIDSQLYFLGQICTGHRILILGGGTGWILNRINKGSNLEITFVDDSHKMIERAKNRKNTHRNNIKFINGTIKKVTHLKYYDIVITNFFLDVLDNRSILLEMKLIRDTLKDNAKWIFTDFQVEKIFLHRYWQTGLLKIMYIFFRIWTGMKGSKLPDFERLFNKMKLKKLKEKLYFKRMIVSRLYTMVN